MHQRRHAAAEVGAEYQRQRFRRADDVTRCQGRHQQHDGDARVTAPCEQKSDEHREHGLRIERLQDRTQQWRVLDRTQRVLQTRKRHQHESKADRRAADVLQSASLRPAKHEHSDQHQRRGDEADVERQHLRDERRADVCAQHDRERRRQRDDTGSRERHRHQPGRGAALQERRNTEAGEKCLPAMSEVQFEGMAKRAAPPPLHAGAHHVGAPQEQSHLACEFNEDDRA